MKDMAAAAAAEAEAAEPSVVPMSLRAKVTKLTKLSRNAGNVMDHLGPVYSRCACKCVSIAPSRFPAAAPASDEPG